MTSDQFHLPLDQFHMTSDQFLVTSDQFEMSDDQNWSQNQLVTAGHKSHKTRNKVIIIPNVRKWAPKFKTFNNRETRTVHYRLKG